MGALWDLIVQAVSNPVIVFAVIVSVWNAINDPTTSGLSDSANALTYSTPKKRITAIILQQPTELGLKRTRERLGASPLF